MCPLCGVERAEVDHLFLHCNFTNLVWCHLLSRCSVTWCFPGSLASVFEVWKMAPFLCLWGDSLEDYSSCYPLVRVEREE